MTLDYALREMHKFMGRGGYPNAQSFLEALAVAMRALRDPVAKASNAQFQAFGYLSCSRNIEHEGYLAAVTAYWSSHARPESEDECPTGGWVPVTFNLKNKSVPYATGHVRIERSPVDVFITIGPALKIRVLMKDGEFHVFRCTGGDE